VDNQVLLLLIFIPALSHAAENPSSACWRPCSEHAHSTRLCAKSKRLTLLLTKVTSIDSSVTVYKSLSPKYYT